MRTSQTLKPIFVTADEARKGPRRLGHGTTIPATVWSYSVSQNRFPAASWIYLSPGSLNPSRNKLWKPIYDFGSKKYLIQ